MASDGGGTGAPAGAGVTTGGFGRSIECWGQRGSGVVCAEARAVTPAISTTAAEG